MDAEGVTIVPESNTSPMVYSEQDSQVPKGNRNPSSEENNLVPDSNRNPSVALDSNPCMASEGYNLEPESNRNAHNNVLLERNRNPSITSEGNPIIHYYDIHPRGDINIHVLEQLATDRIKLLKILGKANNTKFSNEAKKRKFIEKKLKSTNLEDYLTLFQASGEDASSKISKAVEVDNIAHYFLRLAYCKNAEWREWFIRMEWTWFACRFSKIENINSFIQKFEPGLVRAGDIDKMVFRDLIINCSENISVENFNEHELYSVHFTDVPYLIEKRKCCLICGFAFVLDTDIIHYFENKFTNKLRKELLHLSEISVEDERIEDIIGKLDIKVSTSAYNLKERKEGVGIYNFDEHSRRDYPLCMRVLHDRLTKTSHLRYYARMQYGLFIKALGLPFEEAMAFWQGQFTKKITEAEFTKQYSYLFKHQYGKVGSRLQYEAFDCDQIINVSVSGMDQHGCPFAHWDKDNLREEMSKNGFTIKDIYTIFGHIDKKNYKEACAVYFTATHGEERFGSASHPVAYYETSVELRKDKTVLMNFELPDIEDIFQPEDYNFDQSLSV